jgi:hypothetical protein
VFLFSTFNADEARAMLQPGDNTIKGSALIRQLGGQVVTCAGTKVALTPATEYAAERMTYLYGVTAAGFRSIREQGAPLPVAEPGYAELEHQSICDPQGHFEFAGVSDGTYFITLAIVWQTIQGPQGGYLMRKVSVSGGQTVSVVLTPHA